MDFYCDQHGAGREVEDGEMELLNPRFACFFYTENGYQIEKRRMNNGLNEMKAKIGSETDTAIEKELKSPCLDRLHLRIQRKSTKKIPLICEATSEQDSRCRSEDKQTLF